MAPAECRLPAALLLPGKVQGKGEKSGLLHQGSAPLGMPG